MLAYVSILVHNRVVNKAPEIPAQFYRSEAGNEPVREWLRGLEAGDRRAIGLDLMRVQFRWPVGMPLVRNLKDGLWEIRSTLPSQRIARLILCFREGVLIVLHGSSRKRKRHHPPIWRWQNAG